MLPHWSKCGYHVFTYLGLDWVELVLELSEDLAGYSSLDSPTSSEVSRDTVRFGTSGARFRQAGSLQRNLLYEKLISNLHVNSTA